MEGLAMIIYIQLFGGGGGTSGGNYKMTGHRLPDTYKPNSTLTRYNNRGIKKDKRWFDKNGEKHIDEHYDGPKNHRYPHKHYCFVNLVLYQNQIRLC